MGKILPDMGDMLGRIMSRRKQAVAPTLKYNSVQDIIAAKAEVYLTRLARAGIDADVSHLNTALAIDEADDGSLNLSFSGPIDNDFFNPVDPVGELNQLSNLINTRKASKIPRIDMSINSPGGDMSVAMGLANALRAKANEGVEVVTRATGMVASAATLIYLAGDTRYYAPGAEFMTHAPSIGVLLYDAVNTKTLARMREDLDLVEKVLVSAEDAAISYYADRLDKPVAEITKLMDEEIFWTRADVMEEGVATIDGAGPSRQVGSVKSLLAPKVECKHENVLDRAVIDRIRAQAQSRAVRAVIEQWQSNKGLDC